MTQYAANTEVPADRSRAEIERTLERYGATGFMYGWEATHAMVMFRMNGKMLRFLLPLPDRKEFRLSPSGRKRTDKSALEAYDQAVRQKWRALSLVIKAKLEAVQSGITSFEQEFLGNILLPSGQSVGEWMGPQVEQAYLTGQMPALLPMLPANGTPDSQ
jgi:hypothetical protein